MSKFILISVLSSSVFLAGCLSKSSFETTPVKVVTPKGTVMCQLYTHKKVLWDEAISAPAGMSIDEADRICFAEGQRVAANGL